MPADEFEKLKDDIQKNGQLDPIWVTLGEGDGVLLDGRHRLRACRELGIVPLVYRRPTPTIGASHEDFIWAHNVLRRHLTNDQRAAISLKWADGIREAAKDAQKRKS